MAQHEWDALLNWDRCTQTLREGLEEIQNTSKDCQLYCITLYDCLLVLGWEDGCGLSPICHAHKYQ